MGNSRSYDRLLSQGRWSFLLSEKKDHLLFEKWNLTIWDFVSYFLQAPSVGNSHKFLSRNLTIWDFFICYRDPAERRVLLTSGCGFNPNLMLFFDFYLAEKPKSRPSCNLIFAINFSTWRQNYWKLSQIWASSMCLAFLQFFWGFFDLVWGQDVKDIQQFCFSKR